MGILVNNATRVLCFAGESGRLAAAVAAMREAGTHVVALVDPAGGCTDRCGLPAFDTAVRAVRDAGANAAVVLLPRPVAADALMEAVDAHIPLIVCTARGVPVRDMVKVINYLQGSADLTGPRHSEGTTWLLGPGSAGVITPGAGMVGVIDVRAFRPGRVAIVSRSNCLAEAAGAALGAEQIGQSTCIATGFALVSPTRIGSVLGMLEADPDTEIVVLIGGVGGGPEFEAAAFIKEAVAKPVIAFLPGRSAPPGINIGAEGDFVSARADEIEEKTTALRDAGVQVVARFDDIVPAVAEKLQPL